MEEDQRSENGLERRFSEMTVVAEEKPQQQSDMQTEMQRQAETLENERKRWHSDCRKIWKERKFLLKPGAEQSKPKVTGLVMSSRVIGGSKASGSHLGNRARLHNVSDGLKEKLLEVVQLRREELASNLQRQREALEADQTARAMETLSISEQSKISNPLPSQPLPPKSSNLKDKTVDSFADYERRLEDFIKRRRMQQQLASVLHAQSCEPKQVDALGNMACGMPCCSVTSKVLEHMRTCTFVTKCPTPMCSLTREVLNHYKNCTTDSCQICQQAKRESMSTQEHLLKFMDTICKGLDEEASVGTPSVPNMVNPPINSLLYPDCPELTSFQRSIIKDGAFFPMRIPGVIDITSLPYINPLELYARTAASIYMPSVYHAPITSFMYRMMQTKTEGTSTETEREGSDAHE